MRSYLSRISRLCAFSLLCGVLIGCAAKKGVESATSSHSVSIVRDTLRDSVYIINNVHERDSIVMYMRGDTVYKDRWKILTEYQDRWRDRWRTEIQHDTIIKTDSVRVTVEKRLTRWQQVRIWGGNIMFVLILGAALVIALKCLRLI